MCSKQEMKLCTYFRTEVIIYTACSCEMLPLSEPPTFVNSVLGYSNEDGNPIIFVYSICSKVEQIHSTDVLKNKSAIHFEMSTRLGTDNVCKLKLNIQIYFEDVQFLYYFQIPWLRAEYMET